MLICLGKHHLTVRGRFLDLGCGTGEPGPGFFNQERLGGNRVNFSQKMLELAKKYQPDDFSAIFSHLQKRELCRKE